MKTTQISENEYLKLGANKIFKKDMSREELDHATSKINAKYKKIKCWRNGRPRKKK